MAFSKNYGFGHAGRVAAAVALVPLVLVAVVVLLVAGLALLRIPAGCMELYAERASWPPDY
ncbi:hypothetical protein [Phnomibacter sp. MR]|uniref:hypothetical protein n=1 Tax=Phnomibacter sp. MR TaxID=3042318 RepID=UPI003A7FD62E